MTEHTTGSPLGECEADSVTNDGILTTVRPVGPSQLHRPYKTPLAPSNGQGELSLHDIGTVSLVQQHAEDPP